MTADQWFAVARDIVMGIVAVLVFYWGLARKQHEGLWRGELALRDQRLNSLENRVENAARQSSDLMGDVQTNIGQVIRIEEQLRESQKDRERLWAAIRNLEQRQRQRS